MLDEGDCTGVAGPSWEALGCQNSPAEMTRESLLSRCCSSDLVGKSVTVTYSLWTSVALFQPAAKEHVKPMWVVGTDGCWCLTQPAASRGIGRSCLSFCSVSFPRHRRDQRVRG